MIIFSCFLACSRKVVLVCSRIIELARNKDIQTAGPVRLPRKTLYITTRKTPNGEGSKTWDKYQMRIYKRLIDLIAPSEAVKAIVRIAWTRAGHMLLTSCHPLPSGCSCDRLIVLLMLVSQLKSPFRVRHEVVIHSPCLATVASHRRSCPSIVAREPRQSARPSVSITESIRHVRSTS